MVSILLLIGTALVLASFLANASQAEQRQAIRVEVERDRRRPRR